MKFLKPIRWKEGMFLRPHHLQQFYLHVQSIDVARAATLESHAWGLVHLELVEPALNNFEIGVARLQAVLPDGTLIDVPGNATIANRSFQDALPEGGEPLVVSVGVRKLDDNRPQVQQTGDPEQARFVVAEQEVNDLDLGRDPADIELLKYDLRFVFEGEPAHGYETLPITRLVRTGDRATPVKPDAAYAPPTLLLKGSATLHRATKEAVQKLAQTLRELGQRRGDPDLMNLYQSLASCLPVLSDMAIDGEVHPRRAYQEMARLAGALFYRDDQGRSPDVIPAYDHREPAPVFETLRGLISDLSGWAYKRRYLRRPMERSGEQFEISLPAEIREAGVRTFLELETAEDPDRAKKLMQTVRISNPSRIETLRSHALRGVPTEWIAEPPKELEPGQKGVYFRMDTDHNEWSTHVLTAGQLTVFVLGAPPDLKINLLLVFPD